MKLLAMGCFFLMINLALADSRISASDACDKIPRGSVIRFRLNNGLNTDQVMPKVSFPNKENEANNCFLVIFLWDSSIEHISGNVKIVVKYVGKVDDGKYLVHGDVYLNGKKDDLINNVFIASYAEDQNGNAIKSEERMIKISVLKKILAQLGGSITFP